MVLCQRIISSETSTTVSPRAREALCARISGGLESGMLSSVGHVLERATFLVVLQQLHRLHVFCLWISFCFYVFAYVN